MAYGLGKNSPVNLALGKESYEAMIDRHGQYVRWRQARKCPCVTTSNQPDIHCEKCAGSGRLYSYQTEYTFSLRLQVINNFIELPEEYSNCTVKKIYDYIGIEYEFKKQDKFIQLINPLRNLTRGEQVDIVLTDNIVSTLNKSTLTRICKGFYRVNDLKVEPSKIQGVYYTPHSDVINIEKLKDKDNNNIEIIDYAKDCVKVNTEIDSEVLFAENIEYIKPFKFIVLSQNLNKETMDLLQKHSGDAVCTFPYMYDVSEDDVITILSGNMTNKIILKKTNKDEDIIPEFFIHSIEKIETTKKSYKENEDFILTGTNRIHWLDEKPESGQAMSIVYKYNPTYIVAQNIPMLRTSEDQRIPRKVILKLLSSFQEKQGVHLNG